MTPREQIRARLPERPLGASAENWADICAEIEDHLIEAYDEAAESEVGAARDPLMHALDDLGDAPDKLVRRLWWDSLGGHWLRAWVQTISIVILVTVVTIISVQLFREFQAVAREGRAMLSAIPDEVSTTFFVWRRLDIAVRRGSAEGTALDDVRVSLTGRPFKNDYETLEHVTDESGRCAFGPIRVGQYRLAVEDSAFGIVWERDIVLYPVEDGGQTTMILPEPTAPASLRFDVPESVMAAVPALLVEADVVPRERSPWTLRLDIVVGPDGVARALRDEDSRIQHLPVKRAMLVDHTRVYSLATTPGETVSVETGGALQISAVRVLNDRGVASSRQLPIGVERRVPLRAGDVNVVALDLDLDSVLALEQAFLETGGFPHE